MIYALVPVLMLALGLWRWRRQRALTHAGLNANKPQFSIEPPRRGMGDRRSQRL